MRLAFFSNAPRSGKTTCAKLAAQLLGGHEVVSFATPLKQMVSVFLRSIKRDGYLNERLKDEPIPGLEGKTARDLYISLGTTWGRENVCEDVWLKPIQSKIDLGNKNIIIDDLRAVNEYEYLRSVGFKVVYVDRGFPTSNKKLEGLLRPDQGMVNVTTINNKGSLTDLQITISNFLQAGKGTKCDGRPS